ncbi:MAG: hypothetical protein HGA22_14305 [Clostridiales bacterium]|nr:hypothetical protein [Clostridiales bacterium]
MEKSKDNIILSFVLIATSALIYLLQYQMFHKPDDTVFYLLQDLAFLPVQALIVTMVLNEVLSINENKKKMKKVNVIISTFFVDAGVEIMTAISRFNRNNHDMKELVKIEDILVDTKKKVKLVNESIKNFKYEFHAIPDELDKLSAVMTEHRGLMLDMLENSNLLEHESFTDMLWAVFHVADELKSRGELAKLPQEELEHLANDFKRAYTALIIEWIKYIKYLKAEYPFLYSTAVRKSPFLAIH